MRVKKFRLPSIIRLHMKVQSDIMKQVITDSVTAKDSLAYIGQHFASIGQRFEMITAELNDINKIDPLNQSRLERAFNMIVMPLKDFDKTVGSDLLGKTEAMSEQLSELRKIQKVLEGLKDSKPTKRSTDGICMCTKCVADRARSEKKAKETEEPKDIKVMELKVNAGESIVDALEKLIKNIKGRNS